MACYTRGAQKVRGPTKKENEFFEETRCEGCDVIKTVLTQPLPNWSCYFAQAVGCYFKLLFRLFSYCSGCVNPRPAGVWLVTRPAGGGGAKGSPPP